MAAGAGEATVDFGSGTDIVTISIARASVNSGTTRVEAALLPKSTGNTVSDHNEDEHMLDAPLVWAHSVVTGVGFSVSAKSPPLENRHRVPRTISAAKRRRRHYLSGKYTIQWVATE